MEASLMIPRRSFALLSRASRCECTTSTLRSQPTLRVLQSKAYPRAFSTSILRGAESSPEPHMNVSRSRTHSSSPPQMDPRESLVSYINSVQKIIDGHELGKSDNMNPRQYQGLQTALAQAEARLNAPDANTESFTHTLRAVQAETQPALSIRFGTDNLTEIISKIGQHSSAPQQRTPRQNSVAALLDKSFPSRPRAVRESVAPEVSQRRHENLNEYYNQAMKGPGAGTSLLDGIMSLTSKSNTGRATADALGSLKKRDEEFYRRQAEQDNRGMAIRLSPSIGKTVDVLGNVDLNRAFQKMEMICSRNRVKRDTFRQRFHIRAGQLRKNLRIERWRQQFKAGFQAELSRVNKMRRQGW